MFPPLGVWVQQAVMFALKSPASPAVLCSLLSLLFDHVCWLWRHPMSGGRARAMEAFYFCPARWSSCVMGGQPSPSFSLTGFQKVQAPPFFSLEHL